MKKSRNRIRISGSVRQIYGSEDPVSYKNVTDPEHCFTEGSTGSKLNDTLVPNIFVGEWSTKFVRNMVLVNARSMICELFKRSLTVPYRYWQLGQLGVPSIVTVPISWFMQLIFRLTLGCGSGSGSVLDPYSIGSVDPDPDPGGQKWPTKVDNNL